MTIIRVECDGNGVMGSLRIPSVEPLDTNEFDVDIPVTIVNPPIISGGEHSQIATYMSTRKVDNGVVVDRLATDYNIDGILDTYIDNLSDVTVTDEIDSTTVDAMSVAQLKKYKQSQIIFRYNHAMGWILGEYERSEIESWPEQKVDADNWATYQIATPGGTDFDQAPMLKELAKSAYSKTDGTLTVADMDTYKDNIIGKSDFFRPYSGGLVGLKKRLLQVIEDQLDDFSGEPDPVVAEQLAKDALKDIDSSEILAAGIAFIAENT